MAVFVLDSNIYLNFRPAWLDDWAEILTDEPRLLLVPTSVVDELDDKKDFGTRKYSTRARAAIRRLGDAVDAGGSLGCFQRVIPYTAHLPPGEREERGLGSHKTDDAIVGQVLRFSDENPSERVILVSDDLGMRWRARNHDIQLVAPPDSFRLEEPDAVRPKKEDAPPEPKLTLRIKDADTARRVVLVPDRTAGIQRRLEAERRRLAYHHKEIEKPASTRFRVEYPSQETIVEYGKHLEDYLQRLDHWLHNKARLERERGRFFEVALILENTGTLPAEDIDLSIGIPSAFDLELTPPHEDPGEEPSSPKPPEPRIVRSGIIDLNAVLYPSYERAQNVVSVGRRIDLQTKLLGAHLDALRQPGPDLWGPEIKESKRGHTIEYGLARLKHGRSEDLEPFYVGLKNSDAPPQKLGLAATAHVANQRHGSKFNLVVSIAIET